MLNVINPARVGEVRRDALAHLQALAGDASMCSISRSGQAFPSAKYHEGRLAAAAQVRRLPAGVTLDALRAEWTAMCGTAVSRGSDWQAYAHGGLDALDEIEAPADPDPADPDPDPADLADADLADPDPAAAADDLVERVDTP
jgi:hypothetical protein